MIPTRLQIAIAGGALLGAAVGGVAIASTGDDGRPSVAPVVAEAPASPVEAMPVPAPTTVVPTTDDNVADVPALPVPVVPSENGAQGTPVAQDDDSSYQPDDGAHGDDGHRDDHYTEAVHDDSWDESNDDGGDDLGDDRGDDSGESADDAGDDAGDGEDD